METSVDPWIKHRAALIVQCIEAGDVNTAAAHAQELVVYLGGTLNLNTVSPGLAAVYLHALILARGL